VDNFLTAKAAQTLLKYYIYFFTKLLSKVKCHVFMYHGVVTLLQCQQVTEFL